MNRVFIKATAVTDILEPHYPAKLDVFPDPNTPDPTITFLMLSYADGLGELAVRETSEMKHASCAYTHPKKKCGYA